MAAFHDITECRIGDIHRLANRYINVNEKEVVKEQTEKLDDVGKEISEMRDQTENRSTTAGIIAKDADRLAMAFTAKAYMEQGYKYAEDWINNIEKGLRTESAKNILQELKKSDSNEWWQGLKKLKE